MSHSGSPAFTGRNGDTSSTSTGPTTPKPTSKSSPRGRGARGEVSTAETLGTSATGSGSRLGGQPPTSDATSATRPPVTTGTSTPAYTTFLERDPSYPRLTLEYQSITAMPAYECASLEELRAQDYQQNRRSASTPNQTSSGTPVMPTRLSASPFGIFGQGQGTTGISPSTNNPSPRSFTFKQSLTSGRDTIKTKTVVQTSPALGRDKLDRIEELLRKSLLGEEIVNTQFHLFSARSSKSGRVMKPRVVCANNSILAKSSRYFLDLLGSDVDPSDQSLMDLIGDNDIPSSADVDDYGYESDSDLDDCDSPLMNLEARKGRVVGTRVRPAVQPDVSNMLSGDDCEESVCSDTSVRRPEQPSLDELPLNDNEDETQSAGKDERETTGSKESDTALRLRSLGSRHILVKDTAFRTWYALLNYLYTGKSSFLPLSSTTSGVQRKPPMHHLNEPMCSAKSMYRLASKVGSQHLRYRALAHIRNNLTEHNILQELSCRLLSKYPELLEMELDTLYFHIASPSVIANFAAFSQRISSSLPHGGQIVHGIYTRFLKEHYAFSLKLAGPTLPTGSSTPPEGAESHVNVSNALGAELEDEDEDEDEDEPASPSVTKSVTQAESLSSRVSAKRKS